MQVGAQSLSAHRYLQGFLPIHSNVPLSYRTSVAREGLASPQWLDSLGITTPASQPRHGRLIKRRNCATFLPRNGCTLVQDHAM